MKKTIVRASIVAVALFSSAASPLFAITGSDVTATATLGSLGSNFSDIAASAPLGAISSTIGSSVGGTVGIVGGNQPVGGGNDQGQGGQNDQNGQNDQQRQQERER